MAMKSICRADQSSFCSSGTSSKVGGLRKLCSAYSLLLTPYSLLLTPYSLYIFLSIGFRFGSPMPHLPEGAGRDAEHKTDQERDRQQSRQGHRYRAKNQLDIRFLEVAKHNEGEQHEHDADGNPLNFAQPPSALCKEILEHAIAVDPTREAALTAQFAQRARLHAGGKTAVHQV